MKPSILPVPLGLYLHTPWCVQKCPYCDFNSHTLKGEPLPEQQYIDMLLRDLEADLPLVWGRTVQHIFIGGGTPSLLSPEKISLLLNSIRSRIAVKPDAEITMEANPGTVEQARFEGYLDAGINRLSIGIQSFNAKHLKALGRIHSNDEAIKAVQAAQNAGFTNINCDLMYGLPNQSLAQAMNDLQQAIDLKPNHISWYQLTLEPNTMFYHRPPKLPVDDTIWAMQQGGVKLLDQHGYKQYEVSAYAKDQHYCQHNLNYWQFGDYLGIGAGAHSKITNLGQQQVVRAWKIKHPKSYFESHKNFVQGKRVLSDSDLAFEFMMNVLRLNQGTTFELFEHRTGLTRATITEPLHQLAELELIEVDDESFRVSQRGQQYLNEVLERFL